MFCAGTVDTVLPGRAASTDNEFSLFVSFADTTSCSMISSRNASCELDISKSISWLATSKIREVSFSGALLTADAKTSVFEMFESVARGKASKGCNPIECEIASDNSCLRPSLAFGRIHRNGTISQCHFHRLLDGAAHRLFLFF